MRKRNFVIATVLGVVGSLAFSGIASAAPGGTHPVTINFAPTKQQKKVQGPVSITAFVDEQFSGGALFPTPPCSPPAPSGCTFSPPAIRSVFNFDTALTLRAGNLAKNPCQLSQISTASASTARGSCAKQLVGTGNAVIRTLSGGFIFAQVSAFVGGPTLVFIHIDIATQTNKPVLSGNLTNGGHTLDVTLQPVTGTVIDDIGLNVSKKVVVPRNKKKDKPAKYFASARCNDGTWNHTQQTTFQGGSTSTGIVPPQKCKQLKPKG
jgi:hypothetical protein